MSQSRLDWESILVTRAEDSYRGPIPGKKTEHLQLGKLFGEDGLGTPLHASAIREIPAAITRAYKRSGFAAVKVSIEHSALAHLREENSDGVLEVIITEGRVGRLRASVRRVDIEKPESEIIPEEERGFSLNRILDLSPVGVGDIVRIDDLDLYTKALNRRSHRHVDIALSPGEKEGEVSLDFHISTQKPWTSFMQVSNTGTAETGRFREQIGLVNEDLLGLEDRLFLAFVTAEFDEASAGVIEYKIPIKPAPRFNLTIDGLYSEYDASEVGAFNMDFNGSTVMAGVDFEGTLFQHDTLFVDMSMGTHFEKIRTQNDTLSQQGKASFLILNLGFDLEHRQAYRSMMASIDYDHSLEGIDGTDREAVQALGRTNGDDDWKRLRATFDTSLFLEAFTVDEQGDSPRTLAHELAIRFRAQHNLGNRFPPNHMFLNGGFHTLRGYPESYASGDRGYNISFEYRFHIPRVLESSPASTLFGKPFKYRPEKDLERPDWDWIFRTFLDLGQTYNDDRLSFERDLTLVSFGIGSELVFKRNINLRIDWGFAGRGVDNGTDDIQAGYNRLHFLFTLLF